MERSVTHASLEANGSSVREMSLKVRVQAEAGVQGLATLTFPYTASDQSVDIEYVRVQKPDGTTVETPPSNVLDMPADVTRVAPVYSDIHEKHVTVKGLSVGDTLEYAARFRTSKPPVPGQFWFDYTFLRDVICRDEELELSVPHEVVLTVSSPEVKPQVRDEGRRRIYTWKTASPERKDKGAQALEESGPSVQVTTFRSWQELGGWYGALSRPEAAVTPAIRAKAAELTKGLTSDGDRIRALYAFVSTKIHYVSLSFGIGRFQPHAAEEVLENDYGDCKDKHTLLAALLKASGFDAWPALVNILRPVDPAVPSPGQFDHLISVVRRGSDLLWLDTTPEVAPFGMLLPTLRDRYALVIPDDSPARLICVPASPPFPLSSTFTGTAELASDGALMAHFERAERSDVEMLLRMAFRNTPRTSWVDLAQRLSYSGGFGGTVSNVEASLPDDTSNPFRISYDYTRKDFGDWSRRLFTMPMPYFALPALSPDAPKPTEPIALGAPAEYVYRVTLELPPNYDLTVPKAVDLKTDFAEYHAKYSLKGRALFGERILNVVKPEVPLSQLEDYAAFQKAVSDDYGTWLTLVSPSPATATTQAVTGKPEAKPWFDNAIAALQRRDFTAAEENLRRVLRVDPAYPRAHSTLGGVFLTENQPDRGLAELRREVHLHPDDAEAHHVLAVALIWLHREGEAIDAWRGLLRVDPQNLEAATNLGNLLVKAKRYPEALQVLEGAARGNPESASLQASLGEAYLATRQTDKALAAMTKAVEVDPSAETMNDVSYRMAEEGALLDKAREWAEKAVARTEADSAGIKVADFDVEDLVRTGSLAMYWDTLGWVYFRTGELAKAERYLRAAWLLSQIPTCGLHLARLYERQGKRDQAARTYETALAAGSGTTRAEITRRYERLTGRSVGNAPSTAADELTRVRTFKLPRLTTQTASAEFLILLAPGPKTIGAKFLNGSEALRGAAEAIGRISFNPDFPDDAPSTLTRDGIVSCSSGGCDLVLLPASASRPPA